MGLEVLGLLDQPAALGVAGEDLLDEVGAALVGERALDRLGLLADQPEVEHGRATAASAGAAVSASTRAIEPDPVVGVEIDDAHAPSCCGPARTRRRRGCG